MRYKDREKSETGRNKHTMAAAARRCCTYVGCERPDVSTKYHIIEEGTTNGGQDWSSIVGNVLCDACFNRYSTRGFLGRLSSKPLTPNARRCTYMGCDNPELGNKFYQIEEGRTTGGQDWEPLIGSVLCNVCYHHYKAHGTLERNVPPLVALSQLRCTYQKCERPEHGNDFFQIEAGKTSGGRDWSHLAGSVLCNACHQHFLVAGTLERASPSKPSSNTAKRCTYDDCDRPEHGSRFYQIEDGKTSGGQDWTALAGSVLCHACYARFMRSGKLERQRRPPSSGRGSRPGPVLHQPGGVVVGVSPSSRAAPAVSKRPKDEGKDKDAVSGMKRESFEGETGSAKKKRMKWVYKEEEEEDLSAGGSSAGGALDILCSVCLNEGGM